MTLRSRGKTYFGQLDEMETGRTLRLAAQPVKPNQQALGLRKDVVKKKQKKPKTKIGGEQLRT